MTTQEVGGSNAPPLIEAVGVTKRFRLERDQPRSFQETFIRLFRRERSPGDYFWPLRGLSFTIAPGDSLGILGQNGSGKSTLLKILTGVLRPTGGSVRVRGRVASLLELGAGFHPELTGRENIFLNGSVHGLNRKEMHRKLGSIIDFAELGPFIDTPVKHYSSGMYVRLGFAVAIHTEPQVLIVDEVLTVGDQIFQQKCMERIWDMKREGVAIVLVSHNLEDVRRLCNRAIWLQEGEARAYGPALAIVDDYLAYANELYYAHRRGELEAAESDPTEAAEEKTKSSLTNARRWGTRQAEIVKVEILDAQGETPDAFFQGEPLQVRIHYRTRERLLTPTFGLAIYRNDGVHVNGPNSVDEGYNIPFIDGEGVAEYTIPALPLNPGSYELTVAIYNQNSTVAHDHHHRMYEFQVQPVSARSEAGIVHIPSVWAHLTPARVRRP